MMDFGNVRLVGMSEDEFRKAIDLRVGTGGQLYILPDDILQNTVKAFNVSATSATGYGALGVPTGRYLAPAVPGTWLDPGPYGCLGTGMGYAMGARLTYPDRQVCVLMGDGASGFSLQRTE